MDIERLRALVQSWREIADKHDARAERLNESGDASDAAWCEAAAEHRSYCADELATLIAELGQEVGAVESVWMFRCAGSRDEWMPFVNEKHRLNTMRSPEWEVREFTSPAHTSEARDAARLDWLEKHGCWQFAGPSESDIRGPAYRWFDYDTDGHDYSATLREAIDAAMRQEAGNAI